MSVLRNATRGTFLGCIVASGVLLIGGIAIARQLGDAPTAPTKEAFQHRLTADEVPPEEMAPTQQGDGTVRSFQAFMTGVASAVNGKPAPRPTSVQELIDQTAASARGTITAVRLSHSEVHQGQLPGARIDLIVDLEVSDTIKSVEGFDGSSWTRTLWVGDPAVVPAMLQKLTTELGTGPIGADAVIFANLLETDSGEVLTVFDGLVEDDTGTARLSVIHKPDPQDLTSVQAAMSQSDR